MKPPAPRRTNTVLIILFALIVISTIAVAVPVVSAIKTLSKSYKSSQLKNDALDERLDNLKKLQRQYSDNEKHLARVATALPASKNSSEFLGQIERLMATPLGGRRAGLNSLTISGPPLNQNAKPVPTAERRFSQTYQGGGLYEMPLTITGSGDFITLLTVIERLETLDRLTAITSLNYSDNAITFTLITFVKP